MRVLILSSPKTGNTWLRNLIAGLYRIPQLTVRRSAFEPRDFENAGPAWVTHQHYFPTPRIENWIRDNQVTALTTIRHPADVLISLYHHIYHFRKTHADLGELRRILLANVERTDIHEQAVAFHHDLECSIAWARSGITRLVRYEDMWADPEATLAALAGEIRPASPARIRSAVQLCDMNLQRLLAGRFGQFVRQGGVGGWREILSTDIVDTLRNAEPYRSQLAFLGYTMDRIHPLYDRIARDVPPCPLAITDTFDNGVPVSPVLIKCFLVADDDLRSRWSLKPRSTGAGSFFEWLNRTANIPNEDSGGIQPGISNLAYFVHQDREDLRAAFPDLASPDRVQFLLWFHQYAASEYGLHPGLIQPVREAIADWSIAGAAGSWPLTRFAAHVYDQRPDLRRAFPDVHRGHPKPLIRWLLENASAFAWDRSWIVPMNQVMSEPEPGICIWLIGLPCAGKTTIASALTAKLEAAGQACTLLDGDEVRRVLCPDLTFTREDRKANVLRIAFVAREVVRHGGIVVCATVNPYQDHRDAVREGFDGCRYIEVFVDTPLDVCEKRDVKGMYAKARTGQIPNFTGVSDSFERPNNPSLVCLTEDHSPDDCACEILEFAGRPLPRSRQLGRSARAGQSDDAVSQLPAYAFP